jgi:hypothetical protein
MWYSLHAVVSSRNPKNGFGYNRAGGARFPFSSPGVELVSRAVDGRDLASARERPRWACCSSRAQYGQRRRRTRRVVTTLSVTTAASATTMPPSPGDAVTVAEAARLLGRDRTRVYALIRSGAPLPLEGDPRTRTRTRTRPRLRHTLLACCGPRTARVRQSKSCARRSASPATPADYGPPRPTQFVGSQQAAACCPRPGVGVQRQLRDAGDSAAAIADCSCIL